VFGSVEGGRDQPLGGGEGMGRLSRKATVEKGRVPAYVTQTQREKCASTLPNSHPRPATQCARYHRQALGSHLRSRGDSRGAEARHCHSRLLPVHPPLCQFPPELLSLSGACHPPSCSGIRTRQTCCPAQCVPMLSMMYMQKQSI